MPKLDTANPARNFHPFPDMPGKHGAPMGRHSWGSYDPGMGAIYAEHQDDVWAVWAGWDEPTGEPEFMSYVRAANRLNAIAKATQS